MMMMVAASVVCEYAYSNEIIDDDDDDDDDDGDDDGRSQCQCGLWMRIVMKWFIYAAVCKLLSVVVLLISC